MGCVPLNATQIKPRILHSLCSPLQAVIHILGKWILLARSHFDPLAEGTLAPNLDQSGNLGTWSQFLQFCGDHSDTNCCMAAVTSGKLCLSPRLENLQGWRILRLYCPYCFPEMSCFFLSAWAELLEKQFIRSVISSQLAWYVCASFIFSKCTAVWISDFIVEQSPIFSNQEIIQL